jgi:hypothetical protein
MDIRSSLLSRFDKRWLGAGLAAAGSVAATQATEAAVVWSGNVNIPIPATVSGVYLNVVTGATGTSSTLAGWDVNPWNSGTLNMFSSTTSGQTVATNYSNNGGSTTTWANLVVGAPIAPGGNFSSNVGTQTLQNTVNLNSSNNCVGFRFQNETDGQIHYGTMRIQFGADINTRSIVGYAYESVANTGITACAPEPTSIALLALGALGLTARRRRTA